MFGCPIIFGFAFVAAAKTFYVAFVCDLHSDAVISLLDRLTDVFFDILEVLTSMIPLDVLFILQLIFLIASCAAVFKIRRNASKIRDSKDCIFKDKDF
jgi:hypothetical protein